MSRGVNKAIIIGNCGNDPETRHLAEDRPVCRVSVATSEQWKDKATGEKKERTEWHRVVAFGRLAEIMQQYLKKGSKVYIEGSLRTSSYEKDGIKRYSTEIIASEMQMLDSKGGSQDEPVTKYPDHETPRDEPTGGPIEDEIPFSNYTMRIQQ